MTLRKLALLLGVLLPASMAHAQDDAFYDIHACNTGKRTFNVAVVEREVAEWQGYKDWKVDGWYTVEPVDTSGKKSCLNWHKQTWESDWTVSRPGVYLVIAFFDSTGVWGQANFNLKGTKLEEWTTDQEICVKHDNFAYTLPPGKISANCKEGYKPMRASFFFDPAPGGMIPEKMEGIAWYPRTPYEFDIELDNDIRAVSFGESPSTASKPLSDSASKTSSNSGSLTVGEVIAGAVIVAGAAALAMSVMDSPKPYAKGTITGSLLGKKIARWADTESNWYYADGSQVNPAWELEGKKASWIMDPPDQLSTSDPKVTAAYNTLMRSLARLPLNRIPLCALGPTGRLSYATTVGGIEYDEIVNLAALDYGKAKYYPPDDQYQYATYAIPCKLLQHCVGTLHNKGKVILGDSFTISFAKEDNKEVWDPLMDLVALYPAEPEIAVR
jgi:hypothetical protein